MSCVGELHLFQVGSVGEQFLVFVLDGGLVNLPHAVALAVIDDAASVGREIDAALLHGSVGNLFGGLVVHRGHIHVAMHDKGDFFAARRHADSRSTVALDLTDQFLLATVGCDVDIDTLGLAALAQGVDFAVVAIAECAVAGHCEESHGIILVMGELLGLSTRRTFINVERAVLLAQVVIGAAVRCPAGGAVLAVEGSQFGEFVSLLEPDVTCDGRGVMLAEGVLISLDVVV